MLRHETVRRRLAVIGRGVEIDPKLGEEEPSRISRHTATRHNATCYAALAGVGQGEDDPRPDEAARDRLRAQARDWLRADLRLWSKIDSATE